MTDSTTDFIIPADEIKQLRARLENNYDQYYSRRCSQSDEEIAQRWDRDFSALDTYEASVEENRQHFLQLMGGWPWPREDLNPRREQLYENDDLTVYRVFLHSFEDVETDCLLLVPQGITQPRPAVLAQHGLGSTPALACGFVADEGLYHRFGQRLARLGYVVIAPRMIGPQDKRQPLYRKAMLMGERLMGAEMFSLSRAVDYLQALDEVDAEHIGMYGLSQGGQSALWLPAVEKRIKVTIISAFFNLRWQKMVISGGENYTAYIDTDEEDKFFYGQLLEFSDSDIASLICPRCVFVEAGRDDKAVYQPMAAEEFGKLKRIYEKLGIGDRAQIELHDGGHEINFAGAVEFLNRYL